MGAVYFFSIIQVFFKFFHLVEFGIQILHRFFQIYDYQFACLPFFPSSFHVFFYYLPPSLLPSSRLLSFYKNSAFLVINLTIRHYYLSMVSISFLFTLAFSLRSTSQPWASFFCYQFLQGVGEFKLSKIRLDV